MPHPMEAVSKVLHGSNPMIDFRFELLDKNNNVKKDLSTVLDGSIEQNALAQIKRTASFTLTDDKDIDYLNDRIKPYYRIFIPPELKYVNREVFITPWQLVDSKEPEITEGYWIEKPLGIFLLSSPTVIHDVGSLIREVDAYDLSQILLDDKLTDTLTFLKGSKIVDAVVSVLTSSGIKDYNIESSNATMQRDVEYEIGESKLTVINNLLDMINYVPIHVDELGYFTSYPYVRPDLRAIDYEYLDDEFSIIEHGAERERDLFGVPNVFVVVRNNPDELPIKSVKINDNPDSILSTVSRGRSIVDYREIEDIASQKALDEYTERIAFEATQVYGRINFTTALNPMHNYSNVIRLKHSLHGIDGKYLELSWSMELRVGGQMSHTLREVSVY